MDALGNPVRLMLSAGNVNDINYGEPMLEGMLVPGINVLADKGYDSQRFADYIESFGAHAHIPSRSCQKQQRKVDWHLYKNRHLVECFFRKLKNFRRVATRYDKYASSFLAFVLLASICIWIR